MKMKNAKLIMGIVFVISFLLNYINPFLGIPGFVIGAASLYYFRGC